MKIIKTILVFFCLVFLLMLISLPKEEAKAFFGCSATSGECVVGPDYMECESGTGGSFRCPQ